MNALSLFDGMSCGRIALSKSFIKISNYFSSEIIEDAINVAQFNYPENIPIGDIRKVSTLFLPKIDLLIGGSPCQSFSFAGKRNGMSTKENFEITDLETYLRLKDSGVEFEGASYLFWEYIRILREIQEYNPDVIFLLENVVMEKKWEDIISAALGVRPVLINSSLVSAQNRRRLYWTNIKGINQPEDKNIYWNSIHMDNADNVYYVTEKMMSWIKKDSKREKKFKIYTRDLKEKMQMLEHSHYKGISNQRCFAIEDVNGLRYIHPEECELLQTVPAKYTKYKGINNLILKDIDFGLNGFCTEYRSQKIEISKTIYSDEYINLDLFLGKSLINIIDLLPMKNMCTNDKISLTIGKKSYNFFGSKLGVAITIYLFIRNKIKVRNDFVITFDLKNFAKTLEIKEYILCSNSSRYKMLGNGWTVDVVSHILSTHFKD